MSTILDGRDTWCVDSLRPGHLVSGKQLLAQRCYHRLITPRGSLRGGDDEANFGLDLIGMVGSTETKTLERMLPVRVTNELLKDAEVSAVTVDAVRTGAAGKISWQLTITITPVDDDEEIALVMAVSDVTAQLLGVS